MVYFDKIQNATIKMNFILLTLSVLIGFAYGQRELDQTDSEYWNKLSSEALHASLQNKFTKQAKNVIIFLGDGMGVSTITSARTLRRQNEKIDQLGFETFPHLSLIKVKTLIDTNIKSTTAFPP